MNIDVVPIPYCEVKNWLLHKHYARRMSPVSFSFGAYSGNELIGVITYGMPPSPAPCKGVCGIDYKDNVLELNRLCCENSKNIASFIISKSLKQLPTPKIILSYADIGQGHVGYIYQATNWIYTGIPGEGKVIIDKIKKGKHGRHAVKVEDRENVEYELFERTKKHRYVFFVGSKKQKKEMLIALKYPILPYPKGESKHYDTGEQARTQLRLL